MIFHVYFNTTLSVIYIFRLFPFLAYYYVTDEVYQYINTITFEGVKYGYDLYNW